VKKAGHAALPGTTKQRIAARLDRWDAVPVTPPPLDPTLERSLRKEFEPDITYVEQLCEIRLERWRISESTER